MCGKLLATDSDVQFKHEGCRRRQWSSLIDRTAGPSWSRPNWRYAITGLPNCVHANILGLADVNGNSTSIVVGIIARGVRNLLQDGTVITARVSIESGAGFIPSFEGVNSFFGFQLAGALRDPFLQVESKPLLYEVGEPDDIPIPFQEFRGNRPFSPNKRSLFSLCSRYHFEETTATQQANMLVAKLNM